VSQRILRFLGWAVRAGESLGALATVLIAVVIVYDVVVRTLGYPTLWVLEVSGYLMVAAAVLAAGQTLRQGGHFEVRLLVNLLPPRVQQALDRLVTVLSACFVLAITWGAIRLVMQSYAFGFRSPTLLRIPLFVPHAVLVLGLALLAVAYLIGIAERFRGAPPTAPASRVHGVGERP
jgi:TRAP-type C4-dicarboxylate transport system permease small subunit